MKTTQVIYGLFDPITHELRYIGRSNSPEKRLANHIGTPANEEMAKWIESLAYYEKQPYYVILQSCDGLNPKDTESSWIQIASMLGANLINGTGTVKGLNYVIRVREQYDRLLEMYFDQVRINQVLKDAVVKHQLGIDTDVSAQEVNKLGISKNIAVVLKN